MTRYKAALFDLDGVIFDTEPQYTRYWKDEFCRYYPDRTGLEDAIKGETLVQTFDHWFSGPLEAEREKVRTRLYAFEASFNGLRSALDAGTTVIAVTTAHPATELRDLSHFQIPDFTDALDILKLG